MSSISSHTVKSVKQSARGYTYRDSFVVISKDGGPSFRVETIHISCHSHQYRGPYHSYGGIILYGCDRKSDWYTANGTHCNSGYLVIQDTDCKPTPQEKFPNEPGIVHGAIYMNAFGESCTKKKVVGEGFSIENGEFKTYSGVFNQSYDHYHDDNKWMNRDMENYVSKVVQYWKDFTRCQNHNIKDLKD